MKFYILLGLLIISSQSIAQDRPPSALIEKAYNEQNPHKSLEIIYELQNVDGLADSVMVKYLLTKGIAFGKLGKTDTKGFE